MGINLLNNFTQIIDSYLIRGSAGATPQAGFIGERLTQSRVRSAKISLTHGTAANITATALTLTPGVWQLFGEVAFEGSSATSSYFIGAINTTSATIPGADIISVPTNGAIRSYCVVNLASFIASIQLNAGVVNITTNTTYYLVAEANFSGGTVTGWGNISAIRIA